MPSADWLKAWQLQKYKFVAHVSHKNATLLCLSHIHMHEFDNNITVISLQYLELMQNLTTLYILKISRQLVSFYATVHQTGSNVDTG